MYSGIYSDQTTLRRHHLPACFGGKGLADRKEKEFTVNKMNGLYCVGKNEMSADDYRIRLEKEEDFRDVENLVRESFWNVYRPGCSEHYVIHMLRDDPAFIKELDFVMEQDGKLIG